MIDLDCLFQNRLTLLRQDVPSVVSIFAILAMGADENASSSTDFGNSYIEAAYSLYGHLVASPYLPSVQALILLGFALRGKSKDGQCWQLTGQAIRIAHSIGLHRHILSRSRQASRGFPGTHTSDQLSAECLSLEARVWWSCYAIERLMELETGRPSALTEQEIDQIHFPHPQNSEGDSVTGPLHLFILWVSLTRVMGQISEHLYHRRISDSWQLLYETGQLDQLLLEWVKTMPEGIKPGHELVHLGPDTEDAESVHQHQHIAAFLSLQYYQAQITLFRASLAFPTQKYLEEIRSDVELLVGTTEYIEVFYRKTGQSTEFIKGCERLRNSILEAVASEGQSPIQERRDSEVANQGRLLMPITNTHSNEDVRNSGGADIHMSGIEPLMVSREGPPFFEAYEEITWEQLWTSMSTDFMMGQSLDFNHSGG